MLLWYYVTSNVSCCTWFDMTMQKLNGKKVATVVVNVGSKRLVYRFD